MVLTGRRLLFLRRIWLLRNHRSDEDAISNNGGNPSYPSVQPSTKNNVATKIAANPLIESNSNSNEIPHTPPPPTGRKHTLSSRKTRSTKKKTRSFTWNEPKTPQPTGRRSFTWNEPKTPQPTGRRSFTGNEPKTPQPTGRKHTLSSRKTRSTKKKTRSFTGNEPKTPQPIGDSRPQLSSPNNTLNELDVSNINSSSLGYFGLSSDEESFNVFFDTLSVFLSPLVSGPLLPLPPQVPLLPTTEKSMVKKKKRKKEAKPRLRRTRRERDLGLTISQARLARKEKEEAKVREKMQRKKLFQ